MSKRYERMSKEEIVEFIDRCSECEDCGKCAAAKIYAMDDTGCIAQYLKAEVPTKKRWQLIQSDEDLMRIHREFKAYCKVRSCSGCPYGGVVQRTSCFAKYLCEEVEVPE